MRRRSRLSIAVVAAALAAAALAPGAQAIQGSPPSHPGPFCGSDGVAYFQPANGDAVAYRLEQLDFQCARVVVSP